VYRSGIDKLRGFATEGEACQAYEAEANKHNAPLPVRVFRWE
jgi:hypothetical protein